jgi:hypothetical protein
LQEDFPAQLGKIQAVLDESEQAMAKIREEEEQLVRRGSSSGSSSNGGF